MQKLSKHQRWAVTAISMITVSLAYAGVTYLFKRDGTAAWVSAGAFLVFQPLGLWLGTLWRRKLQSKYAAKGQAQCSLRAPAGNHAGLPKKWKVGVAELMPGMAEFRPNWARSVFPHKDSVIIRVLGMVDRHRRKPTFQEIMWNMNTGQRIVALFTPEGVLAFAALPAVLDSLEQAMS